MCFFGGRGIDLVCARSAASLAILVSPQGPFILTTTEERDMKIKIVVHEAEEGGFWAEVPAIPGCATEGETMDELLRNVHEAIEACLSVDVAAPEPDAKRRVLEIAI